MLIHIFLAKINLSYFSANYEAAASIRLAKLIRPKR